MGLETVIQNEASQEGKNKHHMSMKISGMQKNCTEGLIYKAEIETQVQTQMYEYQWGGGMSWEVGIDIYTIIYMYETHS